MPIPWRKFEEVQLDEPIDKGGFGEVWKGRIEEQDGFVAVKQFFRKVNDDNLERIESEMRTMSLINHPNIISLIGYHWEGTTFSVVMEYFDSKGLTETDFFVRPFETDTVPEEKESAQAAWDRVIDFYLKYGGQILDGLSALEKRHIVHRDLRPENILVSPGGEIKIVDFGLSKVLDDSLGLTKTGSINGTPQYMSPEQIQHPRTVDIRADLYSFGVMLREVFFAGNEFHVGGGELWPVLSKHLMDEPASIAGILAKTGVETYAKGLLHAVDNLVCTERDHRVSTSALAINVIENGEAWFQHHNDWATFVDNFPAIQNFFSREAALKLINQSDIDLAEVLGRQPELEPHRPTQRSTTAVPPAS